ncbi:unnamed protein product [Pleuronectes platessa]|uniref:Uncharacterized protein n=1 Tax=Pleuronectes platessa TaxID=8262 RepID=A0A9N7ZBS4_PLEPL|nr:unnamed protein product [Pleuronectes platessa]
MSPSGDGDSDQEPDEDEEMSKIYPKGLTSNYSYLGLTDSSHSLPGGASYDMSPLSSPEKEPGGDPFHSSSDFDVELGEDGERTMDFDENDDSLFSSAPASLPSSASLDPLPDNALLRVKPVHTYSRSSQNHIQNHNYSRPMPGPSSSAASTSSGFPSASDSKASAAAPPLSRSPSSSKMTASILPRPPPASSANDSTSDLASSSSSILPPSAPPPAPSAAVSSSSGASAAAAPSSSVHRSSGSNPCDPLPAGASSRRSQDSVGSDGHSEPAAAAGQPDAADLHVSVPGDAGSVGAAAGGEPAGVCAGVSAAAEGDGGRPEGLLQHRADDAEGQRQQWTSGAAS